MTDHIGKPVLMLDAARRITGVGEYDVSGQVNRVQAWGASPTGETSHPYANQTNSVIADFTQPTHTMAISVRTHFTQMDTEVWNGVTMDWARIENGDTGAVLGGNMGGPHKGDYWSSSVAAPSTGHLKVRFASSLGNCAPWDVYPACTQGFQYSGVALREYEYQRSSATRWGSDTSWRHSLTPGNGWEQPSYNDESWPLATDEGAYGTYPWYTAAPFPAGTPSHWI